MTPSTTNTAARELLVSRARKAADALVNWRDTMPAVWYGNARLIEAATVIDNLLATLTQQQGGEQEARNLVENFEELVSDCHNGDETGWASPRERDRIRANRIAAREELIAAIRTPTAEVGIGDEARLRDYPKLLAFFSKHALGTLAAPSCLCCGHSTQGVEIGVQHLELPAIVICAPCHTTALRTKQPEASEGDGRTFDRGVRAAQDVVRALCCHYQEEMKYPDCSISYLSDLEEVTQGLFWEIDKLLDKTCRVPPKGWHCTRGKDHEGPCAAVRNGEVAPPGTSGSSFWIEEKALEVAQEISQMKSPHRAQLVAGIHLAVTKAMLWAVGGAKE